MAVGKTVLAKEILHELEAHSLLLCQAFDEFYCSILIIVEFYMNTILTACNILFYIFFLYLNDINMWCDK